MNKTFSVLIPVYNKENPEFLFAALNSIWADQILKPSEIVIVKDGPLTKELDEVIESFSKLAPTKCISLDKNYGLGIALAKGVEACSNDVIARMDSDDIAVSGRFLKQFEFLKSNTDIALLSSNIVEFHETPDLISGTRKVPHEYEDILKFAKKRNPMNHMAVIFRKSAVLDAGNYQPFHGYEDYFLWVRMLIKGYRAASLEDNLVYARIGNNMIARRQGTKFFKEELRLQRELKRMNFINKTEYWQNIILRGLPRLLPVFLLRIIYKTLRK